MPFRPDGAAYALDSDAMDAALDHGGKLTLNGQAIGFGVITPGGGKALTGGAMVLSVTSTGNVKFVGLDNASIDGTQEKISFRTDGAAFAFDNTAMANAVDNNKGSLVVVGTGKGFGVQEVGAIVDGKADAVGEVLSGGDSAFKVTKSLDGGYDNILESLAFTGFAGRRLVGGIAESEIGEFEYIRCVFEGRNRARGAHGWIIYRIDHDARGRGGRKTHESDRPLRAWQSAIPN